MDIYKSVIIQDLSNELFLILNIVQVETISHNNEGAIPIRGGIGSPLIAKVGGKSYYTVRCLEIADKVKSKFENKKVNIYLMNDDFQQHILDASIQYKGNDILIETEKMTLLKLNNK